MTMAEAVEIAAIGGKAGGLRTGALILRRMAGNGLTSPEDLLRVAEQMEMKASELDSVEALIAPAAGTA